MNLRKILSVDVIKIGLKSTKKNDVITELVDFLSQTGKIKDKAKVLECVLEREERMSTGIQNSVAIPHGKTDAVDEMIACIAVEKRGIDFEALDNKPSKIFIMTISPEHKTGPHVQFLAEISRLLMAEGAREKIAASGSAEEILSIFCG